MKKSILFIAFFASVAVFGQTPKQYKTNFSGANKKIQVLSAANQLTIEGYAGTEVVIEVEPSNKNFPEEAEGLRVVSAGTVDNTGTGANVTTNENTLQIKLPKSNYFGNFKIRVPKDLAISVKENGYQYGKWFIGGLDGEVEINSSYTNVNIKGVTGPLLARCGYGKLSVSYDKLNAAKPNAITASGSVDISLPADTKANLRLENTYGDIFTDFDLGETVAQKTDATDAEENSSKSASETDAKNAAKTAKKVTLANGSSSISMGSGDSWGGKSWDGDKWISSSSDDCNCGNAKGVSYALNGGGVSLRIHSDHGNIYLRKKK